MKCEFRIIANEDVEFTAPILVLSLEAENSVEAGYFHLIRAYRLKLTEFEIDTSPGGRIEAVEATFRGFPEPEVSEKLELGYNFCEKES